jgi:hypothetical protein
MLGFGGAEVDQLVQRFEIGRRLGARRAPGCALGHFRQLDWKLRLFFRHEYSMAPPGHHALTGGCRL